MLIEGLCHLVSIFIAKFFCGDENVPACHGLNGFCLVFVGVCRDIEGQVIGKLFAELGYNVCRNVTEFSCAKCGDLNDSGDAECADCKCSVDVLVSKCSGCV